MVVTKKVKINETHEVDQPVVVDAPAPAQAAPTVVPTASPAVTITPTDASKDAVPIKSNAPAKDLKDAQGGKGGKAAGADEDDDDDETDPVKRAEKEEQVKEEEKKKIDAKIKALKGGVNKENIKLKEVNPAELQAPN